MRGLREQPRPATARAVARGAVRAAGVDAEGRPVIFVEPMRFDWSQFDREAVIEAHVVAIEEALSSCLGCVDFAVRINAADCGVRQLDYAFLKGLLSMLTVAYPDRLHSCVIGPTSTGIRICFAVLSPFMPARLRTKIRLQAEVPGPVS